MKKIGLILVLCFSLVSTKFFSMENESFNLEGKVKKVVKELHREPFFHELVNFYFKKCTKNPFIWTELEKDGDIANKVARVIDENIELAFKKKSIDIAGKNPEEKLKIYKKNELIFNDALAEGICQFYVLLEKKPGRICCCFGKK